MSRGARIALVVLAFWAVAVSAWAHEFRPAVLALRQLDDETFAMTLEPALDGSKQPIAAVQPVFDPTCRVEPSRVHCPDAVLGTIRFAGLAEHSVDAVVRVTFRNGSTHTAVLRGPDDAFDAATPDATAGTVLATFVALGIEHIAIGIDHVLFVLGLLLLVGFRRRLVWTITGFTLAHSLTLALSTLGLFALSQGPVEAVIAISIVLLAVEIVHDRPSLTRRFPGAVAFGFGLLHGFGFAGALREVGIPPERTGLALLGFNLGVEIGQLAIVAIAFVLGAIVRDRLGGRARIYAAYAGGTVATAWAIERIVALA